MNVVAIILYEHLERDAWQVEEFTTKSAALERFNALQDGYEYRRAMLFSVVQERHFDKDYAKGNSEDASFKDGYPR
jgi:hypothetical protein